MNLRKKFNRGLLLAFALGLAAAGYFTFDLLESNAEEEVLQKARIMMDTALAIRGYTVNEIRPLIEERMKTEFHPQFVPAYAATANFNEMAKKHADYSYKEATENPSNPADSPRDWEFDIIKHFRANPELTELTTRRKDAVNGQEYLSLSRPIRLDPERHVGCLDCHGSIDDAPAPMVEFLKQEYGQPGGFGWKLGDTIGAQVVTVPMSVPMRRARTTFLLFLGSLIGIFALIFLLVNLLLHFIVIRPVVKMAEIANDVSLGKDDVPEYTKAGEDEIASLSQSFNRMRRSMEGALSMLEDDPE